MNWKAIDENIVRKIAEERFKKVIRKDIPFEALCEEMEAYNRFLLSKKKRREQ